MGALHSILAHVQNSEDKAIVVMQTGTGKTETMLSALIANECSKLLVSVPSDPLRTQISTPSQPISNDRSTVLVNATRSRSKFVPVSIIAVSLRPIGSNTSSCSG
ncbi:MAG: DEAD/DEAH box helicase family protein [Chloracidobacterium sp.]|nr:DEAD/DEAH box helicase family protein [Chloracidobacterium sp.]